MTVDKIIDQLAFLDDLDLEDKVDAINEIRKAIHDKSPFKSEPVDFVKWEKSSIVQPNDYNPNSVAPPEMELLRLSILADGFTQPIVTNKEDDLYIVVDGFHRSRVSRELPDIQEKIHGYAPIVQIRTSQLDRGDRMAATIRHNRARGKHKVESMSDIVVELKRRFWSDEKIAKQLGMEPDEVLRLQQIAGLATVFQDAEFSEAWEAESFDDMAGEHQELINEENS